MPASSLFRGCRGLWAASALAAYLLVTGAGPATAAAPAEKPSAPAAAGDQPVSKASGPVGDLLKKWWAKGTAAGNAGDRYDNRDGGHSGLDLGPYPQLGKIEYSDAERRMGAHWALQGRVVPGVVFGNSSTSAGVTNGGSNPRSAYSHPRGLALLYAQYRNNNIYIYPEHRDHDPGRNGLPAGCGDVFPANTPYLIISQGSSGSDRPFMRAVPLVLAALRPEVKRKLVETGLLMPTVQMILRMSARGIAGPADYLTGKAHPTVFDGKAVDDLKMVETAHAIALDSIPPMVQLRVTEEDEPAPGRDFFDAYPTERLGDTPAVIARIYRGIRPSRRMVASAQASYDVNGRPLAFHWVVLRGDASRIRLKTLNEAGSVCEITVPWPERRPVAPGSEMESNRIDIGVFVHNGAYYSAPGFITFFGLDDEARTFDAEGRPVEIGYGLGTLEVSVRDWPAVFDLYAAAADSPGARLLRHGVSADALAAVRQAADEYRKVKADAEAAARPAPPPAAPNGEETIPDTKPGAQPGAVPENAPSTPSKAPKDAPKGKAPADPKAAQKLQQALDELLGRKRPALGGSVKELVEGTLRNLARSTTFWPDHAKDISAAVGGDAGRRGAVESARKRLAAWGLLKDASGDSWELTPVREGKTPVAERLTAYERGLMQQANAETIARFFAGSAVTVACKRNYVDPRIALPKTWRDVYRYAPTGECLGWTRYDGTGRTEFSARGLKVVEKDDLGRCVKGQAVRYEAASPEKAAPSPWSVFLKQTPESDVTEYEYANDRDMKGRVKEPASAK